MKETLGDNVEEVLVVWLYSLLFVWLNCVFFFRVCWDMFEYI
jgi:hypothetical protein